MPASLLTEMNSQGSSLEDQRALQIALELSKLGLNDNDTGTSGSTLSTAPFDGDSTARGVKKSANMTECVPVPSSEHVAEIVGRQGESISADSHSCFGLPLSHSQIPSRADPTVHTRPQSHSQSDTRRSTLHCVCDIVYSLTVTLTVTPRRFIVHIHSDRQPHVVYVKDKIILIVWPLTG